jgi:glycine C-acetyltransferase
MTSQFLSHLRTELTGLKDAGLYKAERVITSKQAGEIAIASGERVLNFCANNYLGLADNAELAEAGKQALDRYGYGMASVRFICGTQEEHKQLEARISSFLGMEDTILYSSCFDANGGLFETLLGEEDAIISDALNHASIIDGVRLSKAKRFRYANNDMAALEEELKKAEGSRFKLIATDGVFSMDGIIANLGGVCDLAEKYGAMVMVDDSHAVGFVGKQGRGSAEHCGVEGRVDIITGTLGKALGGASGGYTSAKAEVVEWLRQRSRPYLFSNTLAPVIAAASLEGVRPDRQWRCAARAAVDQCRAVSLRDDQARLHAGGRGASDHSGHARRCQAGAGHGGADAEEGRLRDRVLFPRGAEGTGAHPHADVGGAFARGCRAGDRGVCRGRAGTGCDLALMFPLLPAGEKMSEGQMRGRA